MSKIVSKKQTNLAIRNGNTMNKRKKTKKRRVVAIAPSRTVMAKRQYNMSTCALDYLHALADPFSLLSNVCIPDEFDTPSLKLRTVTKGTMTIGTLGFGFVTCGVAFLGVSNILAIQNSSAAYVLPGLPSTGAEVGVITSSNLQAPFIVSQIGQGTGSMQYRPVAVGVRVRYIGTELQRAGRVIPFHHPSNEPVTAYSDFTMLSFQQTLSYPTNRAWHGVSWYPTKRTAIDYIDSLIGPFPTTLPFGNNSIQVVVAGATPGQSFEYEIVSYMEYTGSTFGTSPSPADAAGFSTAHSFVSGQSEPNIGPSVWQSALKFVSSIEPADVSGWVQTGEKVLAILN